MSTIRMLDDDTIEKIAAGEVVERPSSIVKELVENSIDALSDEITVEIKEGGKSYIRITDNGEGMSKENIPLAFKRHSTSKLSNIDDLYNIKSLGFRGEALASVSNVSKVEIMTKDKESLVGIQAKVEDGSVLEMNSVGCPKGTTMIIRDLFYNLPVRKNFLKSDLVETNQISDIVYKIALGNRDISFKFIKDNKVSLKTSKTNDLNSHIYSVLGKEFVDNLIEINLEDEDFHITGMISNNQLYRSNRSHQYLYVNGRYVENKDISKVIEGFYKSMIPINRFPVFILFIDINPQLIDVNIHPTKQEIKFSNGKEVVDTIGMLIKASLYPSINIPKIQTNEKKKKDELPKLYDLFDFKDIKGNHSVEENILSTKKDDNLEKTFEESILDEIKANVYDDNNNLYVEEKNIKENKEEKESFEDIISNLEIIGSLFNTYIVAENKILEKVYLVDQHAAHERIMYEKYLSEFKTENVNTQTLMLPEPIDLTSSEMDTFLNNIDIFEDLGFYIEAFGNTTIIIRGVPLVFGKPNVRDLFFDILDNIGQNIQSNYELKMEKIMKIACVNSVKGGDSLNDLEINELFKLLSQCKHPHTCPHGRPTILEISRTEIEKKFLRII